MSVARTAEGAPAPSPTCSLDKCCKARAHSSEVGRRITLTMLCQHSLVTYWQARSLPAFGFYSVESYHTGIAADSPSPASCSM